MDTSKRQFITDTTQKVSQEHNSIDASNSTFVKVDSSARSFQQSRE